VLIVQKGVAIGGSFSSCEELGNPTGPHYDISIDIFISPVIITSVTSSLTGHGITSQFELSFGSDLETSQTKQQEI
jgi:hypothetical protein